MINTSASQKTHTHIINAIPKAITQLEEIVEKTMLQVWSFLRLTVSQVIQ